jgi:hypothetical protein
MNMRALEFVQLFLDGFHVIGHSIARLPHHWFMFLQRSGNAVASGWFLAFKVLLSVRNRKSECFAHWTISLGLFEDLIDELACIWMNL